MTDTLGNWDTVAEREFRLLVRGMLERGEKPTPKRLGELRGRRTIGGRLSSIRIEEFRRAGWVQDLPGRPWRKP